MQPYYTVLVPYIGRKHRTEYHPTDDVGPFSVLSRGRFDSQDEAIEWAQTHLNGTPYTIKLVEE